MTRNQMLGLAERIYIDMIVDGGEDLTFADLDYDKMAECAYEAAIAFQKKEPKE